MKVITHQSGPDLSKIWKGQPSKIDERVKYLFLDFLTEKNEDGMYVNKLTGSPQPDLGLTLEWLYRLDTQDNPEVPNPCKATMSEECRIWAGLDRLDPCVDIQWRIPNSVFDGCYHGWAFLSKLSRDVQIEYIERMECC